MVRLLRSSFCYACLLVLGTVVCSADLRANDDVRAQEEAAMRAAVARVNEATVRIETFGGLERVDNLVVGVGPTTGLVVSEDGFIVSSAFNFVQQPSSILVFLADGSRAAAQIVARDESRMLVLLKANFDRPLTVAPAVPRSEMRVGAWSIAVGRTFAGNTPNVSVGVISALNRIWGKAIQTDAKISPNNYGGPLIDIHGRVLGVLVPLSPQGQDEVAGAEWYDSGIGFAVPLVDVLERLDTWKQGVDLAPGVLGIALQGDNDYTDAPTIGVVRVNSPAEKAGLKVGDTIRRVNGEPTERLGQLKHVLGRLYAGDVIEIEAARGDEIIKASLTLVDKLTPYEHPYLGLLPVRLAESEGVTIRHVLPESPAAAAGLQAGDRLLAWNGAPLANLAALRDQVLQHLPGDKVLLRYQRSGDPAEVEITLSSGPESIPNLLPAPEAPAGPRPEDRPQVGKWQIRIPEQANTCWAYAPADYDPREPYGLLVWLHATGDRDADAVLNEWKDICDQRHLILLLPQAAEETGWRVTEMEFVRKTIDQVVASHNVDRSRVVVGGKQVGAAMAYILGFTQRDMVRGIVAHDAALPARLRLPDNEPLNRLAVVAAYPQSSRLATAAEEGVKQLRDRKFPVTVLALPEQASTIPTADRAAIGRWIDALDRL